MRGLRARSAARLGHPTRDAASRGGDRRDSVDRPRPVCYRSGVGSHYDGTAREKRALSTYVKFTRASESVDVFLSRRLAESDMTVRQLAVLEALLHLGPLSQSELAAKMLRTGGSVTSMVDHLEDQGLVSRARDSNDRRVVRVDLTAKGRKRITTVFPRHVEATVEALSPLTAAEQDELARLCRKLGLGRA